MRRGRVIGVEAEGAESEGENERGPSRREDAEGAESEGENQRGPSQRGQPPPALSLPPTQPIMLCTGGVAAWQGP
jgi:hypothetical protein